MPVKRTPFYWAVLLVGTLAIVSAGLFLSAAYASAAVNFEPEPFMSGGIVVTEKILAPCPSPGLWRTLRVEIFARDSVAIAGIHQRFQVVSASRADGRLLQQSWHGPIVSLPAHPSERRGQTVEPNPKEFSCL